MSYTAKKLAQLSGISVRTLHWYDKIGLLKPGSYGDENGYRYYEKKQLLLLQQILFFRELGFKLEDIAKILNNRDFNQVKALESHLEHMENKLQRQRTLIKTVKRTISDLKSGKLSDDARLYEGFYDWAEKQPSSAYAIVDTKSTTYKPTAAEKIVLSNLKKVDTSHWTKSDWTKHADEGNSILADLKAEFIKGMKPTDKSSQLIIRKHHAYTGKFHHLKDGVYEALAELYKSHPEFKKQIDHHHPKLAGFMAEGMIYFAKTKKLRKTRNK